MSSAIGADGTNATPNVGRFSIVLKPRDKRDASASEIITRLQPKLDELEGIRVYMQPVQDLTVDSRAARAQYQFTLEDPDGGELAQWAPQYVEALRKLKKQLREVASDQQDGGLELHLKVDRDTASRLGISAQTLDDTLYDAFGQRIVSTTFTQLNQYRIILEVKQSDRKDPKSARRASTSARRPATRFHCRRSRSSSRRPRRSRSITTVSSRR